MANIERKRITLTVVGTLPAGTTVWDTDVRGFCARRQRSSTVSYLVKTRVGGQIRWYTIGRHGQPWTPETARKRALKILADPDAVDAEKAQAQADRFADATEQFFATHGPKLKPRSLEEYQRLNRMYLLPTFGRMMLADISRAHVAKAHAAWRQHPRAANHALSVLSKIMSWCEDQGLRPANSNPCRRIDRYPENRRERFLTREELGRLGVALDRAEADGLADFYVVAALRLLILTGARLSEILTLKWSYIDRERQMIFLPDSKTGQKPIALNDAALAVLDALPRLAGNPYVIAGQREGRHLVNLQKPWRAIRKLAGLDEVRIHDLRHTFASVAVASGGSLPVIGRQLGHSQPQTTQRYAHLADDPVRRLTQLTGNTIAAALKRPVDRET